MHLPKSKATWELYYTINDNFPELQLEDKMKLMAAGNVMQVSKPTVKYNYNMRKKKSSLETNNGQSEYVTLWVNSFLQTVFTRMVRIRNIICMFFKGV